MFDLVLNTCLWNLRKSDFATNALLGVALTYPEPSQTFTYKMELFVKIVNGFSR